jgi:hypothetical protein
MITKAIKNCFEMAIKRKWDKTYWVFDIHGTLIPPNYEDNNIPTNLYPFAEEAMVEITNRIDICPILYTCSHPHEIEQYLTLFKNKNINFTYINENPEVKTTGSYGNYDRKFYMNVLFEDKAGFDPLTDWEEVLELIKLYKL